MRTLPNHCMVHAQCHLGHLAPPRPSRLHPACSADVQAKCVLDGETRMVHLMGQLNYAEVLQAVKEKFPHAGPFLLKYLDRCVELLLC